MPTYLLSAIRIQAFEMARSGHFADCRSIESALEEREGDRARLALQQPTTRAHLDQLCKIVCEAADDADNEAERDR
jgi:hypothetical protein